MDKIMNNITNDFNNILIIRNDIESILINIKNKIDILNNIYKDLLIENQYIDNVTLLDSFNFQNKLLSIEYDNFLNIFTKIQNCIYSEYYKLYKKLYNYAINFDLIKSLKNISIYPIYYDINMNNKEYDIDIIINLHKNIINTINLLVDLYNKKNNDLKIKNKQSKLGLNIDNVINTELFNNIMINSNINLFINHLTTYNEHHSKYYSRLMLKVKLILGIINQDIKIKQFQNGSNSNKDLKNIFSNFSKNFDSFTDSRSSSPVCTSSIDENEVIQMKNYMDLDINSNIKVNSELEDILNTNKIVKSNIKKFSLKKVALGHIKKRKKSFKNISLEILLKKKNDDINELISEEKKDDTNELISEEKKDDTNISIDNSDNSDNSDNI